MEYIALDAHKRYSFASVESVDGVKRTEARVEHGQEQFASFLEKLDRGSPVAVETVGNWYWIVGEIEEAGMVPKLVHAMRAKMMLASVNKTDRLDARGMNRLQRSGTLPTVWIPPADLRDQRELFRTRMVFTQQRTRLKNRIQATLSKYALAIGSSDAFNAARTSLRAVSNPNGVATTLSSSPWVVAPWICPCVPRRSELKSKRG